MAKSIIDRGHLVQVLILPSPFHLWRN